MLCISRQESYISDYYRCRSWPLTLQLVSEDLFWGVVCIEGSAQFLLYLKAWVSLKDFNQLFTHRNRFGQACSNLGRSGHSEDWILNCGACCLWVFGMVLFCVTLLTPRISRWPLGFWKIVHFWVRHAVVFSYVTLSRTLVGGYRSVRLFVFFWLQGKTLVKVEAAFSPETLVSV